MADIGTKEASIKWGVPQEVVQRWCRDGKITPQPTQDSKGSPWHISVDAIPPVYRKRSNK